MTNSLTKYLYAALISVGLLSSCTRPTAYFQPSTGYRASQPEPMNSKPSVDEVTTPGEQLTQATVALSQIDAGTGTAAFIGLILALLGALGVILGFFGQ